MTNPVTLVSLIMCGMMSLLGARDLDAAVVVAGDRWPGHAALD